MKRILMTLALMPFMALATTWYVDGTNGSDNNDGTSRDKAKATIQAAIDASSVNDTILVAPGTYAPIVSNNKTITVKSTGGRDATIISGKNVSRCATLGSKQGEVATILDGFTITSGYANADPGAGVRGGTLKNCYVVGCTNSFAIYDSVGGGAGWSHAIDCVFENNWATHAGGLGEGIADRCIFRQNHAADDGGAIAYSMVRDSLIVNNDSSNWGGGGSGAACAHTCTNINCTIVGNCARGGGGIVAARCTLINCILSGNQGALDVDYSSQSTFIDCCTNDNPVFVDAANGDYRLAADSPCIDAGNNAYVMGDTDLDGNVRIVNNVVDIGCYEFQYYSYNVTLHNDQGKLAYKLTSYESATGTNLPDVVGYTGYSRVSSWNWWVDFAFVGWSTNMWGSQGGRTDDLGFDSIDRIEAGETGNKEFWAYWSYVHTWQVGSPKQSDVMVTLVEYAHTMRVSGTGAMTDGIMTTMAREDWLQRMPWYGAFRPYIIDLTIDEGITAIGSYSFQDPGWLERLTLPSTLKSIGEGAFLNHHALNALTIPAGVTNLADRAFATSIGNFLGTVTFEGKPPMVGEDVFAGVEAMGFYPAKYRAAWEAVIDAEGKWQGLQMVCANMMGALNVKKTESLLSVSLNAAGSANIDGEEIAVQPELADEEGFVLTDTSVILTVKTIPGYTYELLGAESVAGPYEVLETKQATSTTTIFEASKDAAKFYKTAVQSR